MPVFVRLGLIGDKGLLAYSWVEGFWEGATSWRETSFYAKQRSVELRIVQLGVARELRALPWGMTGIGALCPTAYVVLDNIPRKFPLELKSGDRIAASFEEEMLLSVEWVP
jgi:hypothetical protein